MNDQSKKFSQATLWDSPNVTFSAELADGHSPLSLRDGQQIDQSGQEVVPASPSVPPAKAKVKRTKDISGRTSFGSSETATLQRALVSKLQAMMDIDGSPEYVMTWRKRSMLSGAPIFRLAARARRTSDSVFSGWPTPDAQDFGSNDSNWERRREQIKAKGINGNGFGLTLGMAATLAQKCEQLSTDADTGPVAEPKQESPVVPDVLVLSGWGTPSARDGKDAGQAFEANPGMVPVEGRLSRQVMLSGWPTPMAGTPAQNGNNEAGNNDSSRKTVELLAGWTTPQANESSTGDRPGREATGRTTEYLGRQVLGITGWATPRAEDAESSGMRHNRNVADTLSSQAGQDLTSSNVETEKRGVLSPEHSRWLQGFPVVWTLCAVMATQSCRRLRLSLSKRSSKQKPKSSPVEAMLVDKPVAVR